jgi:hypothetical protein
MTAVFGNHLDDGLPDFLGQLRKIKPIDPFQIVGIVYCFKQTQWFSTSN